MRTFLRSHMSKEDLKSSGVALGYEIYLLGYPASMYDPQNTTPLLRMGIIASDPVAGYSFMERWIRTPENQSPSLS